MTVYQIHFNYNGLADDAMYYYGYDYPTLYSSRETAELVAELELDEMRQNDNSIEDYTIVEHTLIIE